MMAGRPLVALALVLAGWTSARIVLWTSPFAAARPRVLAVAKAPRVVRLKAPSPAAAMPVPARVARPAATGQLSWPRVPSLREISARELLAPQAGFIGPPAPIAHPASVRPGRAVPAPDESVPDRATSPATGLARVVQPRRWSADSWAVYRSGGASPGAAGPGLLGGSQAGAVLRYTLGEARGRRPAAYLRATSALTIRQREMAAGLSLRPIAAIPLRVHAEVRAVDDPAGITVRPAALITSEVPQVALPARLTGELYGQAGYVGGPDATPFVDGQAQVMRVFGAIGPARIEAGAGIWGAAQRGASRVDIGPSLGLVADIAGRTVRARVDYRQRIAGNAAPGSGPALTVSTGF